MNGRNCGCIAGVGVSGGYAAVGDAMIAALSPALNGPGGSKRKRTSPVATIPA